jgi:multidrug efflux pump subunit AcrA (membrane-fusion protein)
VQLTVTSQKVNNAILVPASAVLNQPEGGTAVMIVGADSRAHVQPVQVGIENAGQVQIASGLKGNEQVIVNGAYGLPDNTQVKIESPSELDKPESDKPDAEKPAAGKPGAAKTTSD